LSVKTGRVAWEDADRVWVRQTKTGVSSFTKVFAPVKKSVLRQTILQALQLELARQTSAAQLARDEAISEESRAQNKWDTHSQEAAYLAEGQAKLAAEIGSTIELYTTLNLPEFAADAIIAVGAVVELETTGDSNAWYFIGPRAGGLEIQFEGHSVLVLTPNSPLGRQLIGKRVGDTVTSTGRGAPVTQRIVAVH
jgi:transcription elongation GreA/GreB family factor